MDLLGTVTVISLNQHDLLRHNLTLFNGTESKDITQSGVSLLVPMCNTHTTTSGDIETRKFALLINDSDEADIVGKDINVVVRWYGNGDFELQKNMYSYLSENTARIQRRHTFRGR